MFKNQVILKKAFHFFGSICQLILAIIPVFILLISPLTASGNPVPGRWQKVASLESNTEIIVHTRDGIKLEYLFHSIVDESGAAVKRDDFRLAGSRVWVGYADSSHEGVFVSLMGDGFLVCFDMDSRRRRIELGTIDKIVLPKTAEYAREWAVWGAVGGVAAGILVSTASFDNRTPSGHLLSALAGAGLGAITGALSGSAAGSSGEAIYISPHAARTDAARK